MSDMRTIHSESFRQKQLRLLDGRQDLMHHMYHINNLVHGEAIADWLLKRGLKGALLKEWLLEQFKDSVIEMAKHIVKDVNNANKANPIILGRDYKR